MLMRSVHCALSECAHEQHSTRTLDSTVRDAAVAALPHMQLNTDTAETGVSVSAHSCHHLASIVATQIDCSITRGRGVVESTVTFEQTCMRRRERQKERRQGGDRSRVLFSNRGVKAGSESGLQTRNCRARDKEGTRN